MTLYVLYFFSLWKKNYPKKFNPLPWSKKIHHPPNPPTSIKWPLPYQRMNIHLSPLKTLMVHPKLYQRDVTSQQDKTIPFGDCVIEPNHLPADLGVTAFSCFGCKVKAFWGNMQQKDFLLTVHLSFPFMLILAWCP